MFSIPLVGAAVFTAGLVLVAIGVLWNAGRSGSVCRRCQVSNRPGARYCAHCGSRLGL